MTRSTSVTFGPGGEDPREWLSLWHESQGGPARHRRLRQMAELLPFDAAAPVAPRRILDLCCGPGDVGRAVHARWKHVAADCVDRDPLLLALCAALNKADGLGCHLHQRDLWQSAWSEGLGPYDAVLIATALHWLDAARLGEVFADIHQLLQPGGVLLIHEPVSAPAKLAAGLARWERDEGLEWDIGGTWGRFWNAARERLAYDDRELEATPDGRASIGDGGLPTHQYLSLLRAAGFEEFDLLAREGRNAIFAAYKGEAGDRSATLA